MKIKNIKLKSPIVLGPMAGFSDCGFRSICSSFGCGLTTTEMVSAKGLLYGGEGSKALLNFEENEIPKAVQIFSRESDVVERIIKDGVLDAFDIIDINMGCPMPKIVKEGMGSALLLDIENASKIIKSAVSSTKKPITVKFRIGYDKNNIIATDFAKMCEDSGASAICVHGRTKTQLYEGKANWDVIGDVSKSVSIPVFGNGDIQNIKQAKQAMKTYGCAGVAIARAALGKPWIFCKKELTSIEKADIIKKHFNILEKFYNPNWVVLHMRKHLACYIKDMPKAKQIRQQIVTATQKDIIFELIDKVFSK